ncbi:hypothetical protein TNCV_4241971 [Trichonephila clavipes]|nr:hypothetical protein TNCV_4241971 [Trichonephila clavipes]
MPNDKTPKYFQNCMEGVVKSLRCSAAKHPVRNDQYVIGHCHGAIGSHFEATDWLETLTAVSLGLGSNPGEGMHVCQCIVPSRHGGTLNSRRATSPLVWLVEGEER